MPACLVTDPRRQFWITVTVGLAGFLAALDGCIVNVAGPTIADELGISSSELAWVALSYLLMLASTMLIFGRLADRYGVRRIFLGGYVVFTLGSLACGCATGIFPLIAARVAQGLGGAAIYIMSFAVVPRFLPPAVTGRSFGIVSTLTTLGIILGAPLGGFITEYLSWNWIFLVNVPCGVVIFAVAAYAIPADGRAAAGAGRFDYAGAVTSFLGLVGLVYAINMGQEHGWLTLATGVCFAASALLLALFGRIERRTAAPLLDLALLADRRFAAGVLAAACITMCMAGSNFLVPFYLEKLKDVSTPVAGVIYMVNAAVSAVTGLFIGRLGRRFSSRGLTLAAAVIGAAASLLFAATMARPGLASVILYQALLGFYLGLFLPANNNLVMGLPPADKKGIAAGVFKSLANLGQVLGVSLFETLFAFGFPAGQTVTGGHALSVLDDHLILAGLRHTMIFAALLLAASFAFSWSARPRA